MIEGVITWMNKLENLVLKEWKDRKYFERMKESRYYWDNERSENLISKEWKDWNFNSNC